jgi:hypothetical protein
VDRARGRVRYALCCGLANPTAARRWGARRRAARSEVGTEEAEMMGEEGRGREKGTGTGTRARAPARAEPHNRTDSHAPADLPGSRHSGPCRLVGSCVPGSDLCPSREWHLIHSWREGIPRQYMYTADGLAGSGQRAAGGGPGAMCSPRRVHRDLAEPGQLGAFAFHHHHESIPARHDDGCGAALVRRPRARDGGRLLPVFQIQNRWSGGSCLLR